MPIVSKDGPLGRAVQWLSRTHFFRLIAPHIVPRLDRALHRLTGGRFTASQLLMPILILETTGRKSGLTRQTPLMCLPERDGSWWVVGSNYGRAHHPAWTANLIADPRAVVRYGRRTVPVTARLLSGEERDLRWPALLAHWPSFEAYSLVSGRDLRLFHLEPDRDQASGRDPRGESVA